MDVMNLPLAIFLSVGALALFSFIAVATWSDNRRREREAFYRSETVKKIAETQGAGATTAVEFLREQEQIALRQRREGFKVGGLVTTAVGLGLMIFMAVISTKGEPAYLVGIIPVLIGLSLLVHGYILSAKD